MQKSGMTQAVATQSLTSRQAQVASAKQLLQEVLAAGRQGRKEWEGHVSAARTFLGRVRARTSRPELVRIRGLLKEEIARALETMTERGSRLAESHSVAAARARGAQVVARIARRLKVAAAALETGVSETQAA